METTEQDAFNRHRKRMIVNLPVHMLERLRNEGPMSRVELARRIGVGPATTGNYVERMLQAGLVYEWRDSSSAYVGRGRPPTLVDLNPEGGSLVGVDLEGPLLRAVRFDFRLNGIMDRVVELREDVDQNRLRRELLKAIEAVRPPEGSNWIGIGLAGPGSLVRAENGGQTRKESFGLQPVSLFPDIDVANLVAAVEERFGRPVTVENDMCCMAYGERLLGPGREHDYFLSVASRAGWTGAAIFANGELTAGPQRGLDIGRWLLPAGAETSLDLEGLPDKDGRMRYNLNALTSARGFLAAYEARRKASGEKGTMAGACEEFEQFCELLGQGDPLAAEAVDIGAEAVGRVIARSDDILNFDVIVLDGIFVELGAVFLERVKNHFRRFSMHFDEVEPEKIVFSQLGDRAAAVGAAGQALRVWEPAPKVAE